MRTTSTSRSASTSDAERSAQSAAHAALNALRSALLFGLCATAARAQGGDVVGTLRVVDRPGAAAHDLGDAVVWLEAPRRLASNTLSTTSAVPSEQTIVMHAREFVPHVRVVRAGGSVAFPNDDPFSHNVFSTTTLGGFDLGLYRHGASRAAPFERPGVYPIYCNIHHKMVSYVVAVATPWATQPSDDGRFALHDVPPGAYVLHAWHERTGETRQPFEVHAGATSVQVQLDARSYVPSSHLNKFGMPYTATRADRY